jgi:hypothetical protein
MKNCPLLASWSRLKVGCAGGGTRGGGADRRPVTGRGSVKCAVHRHLLPNGKVIRTKLGTYALAGTASRYHARITFQVLRR